MKCFGLTFSSLAFFVAACAGSSHTQTACDAVRCGAYQECQVYAPTGEAYCADVCKGRPCPNGQQCTLNNVTCVRAPCPPIAECVATDPNPGSICKLPPDPGPCKALMPSFFFNSATGKCESFNYGGCQGNANRFETLAACQSACGGGSTAACSPACQAHQDCLTFEGTGETYCADNCAKFSCPSGTQCKLEQVQCVRAPCPPHARCVSDDGSTGKACGARAGNTCSATEYCAYEPSGLCGAADAQSVCKPRPSSCATILKEVCGCDGKTYSNSCAAAMAGVGYRSEGACEATTSRGVKK